MQTWAVHNGLDLFGFIQITSIFSDREIMVALNVLLHAALRQTDFIVRRRENNDNEVYDVFLYPERVHYCTLRLKY